MNRAMSGVSLVAAVVLVACGGAKEAPKDPSGTAAVPTASPATSAPTTTTEIVGGSGEKLTANDAGAPHAKAAGEPGRSLDDIRTRVMAEREKARACYDAAQAKKPALEGDVSIAWMIDPKGKVKEAHVDESKSTLLDMDVGMCIVKVIEGITFPPSGKGFETKASYPFNFHPKGPKP